VFEQCAELDLRATGEDRRPYLEPLASAMRVATTTVGSRQYAKAPAGYLAQLTWGAGPIVAEAPEVGERLVREALAVNRKARIEFPDANEAGLAMARDIGLVRVDDDFRMRLGPAVPGFHPGLIYKVLTPAVG
jgi:hypothetical protein